MEMVSDTIQNWRGSIIQHGKSSNRVYLMVLHPEDAGEIVPYLDKLAIENQYTKIFAKIPIGYEKIFAEAGYEREALIPGFYRGEKDALFLGKFFSSERRLDEHPSRIREVIEAAREKALASEAEAGIGDLTIRKASIRDIPELCRIYREVFSSYPFPIYEERYLAETMRTNVRYYVACGGSGIAGVSSSEMAPDAGNTEMTDFATLPGYRGRGLATALLRFMDADMALEGFFTGYTIARAVSYGINITFARNGYKFAGTLINNTNIAGSIESMNVWFKRLRLPDLKS